MAQTEPPADPDNSPTMTASGVPSRQTIADVTVCALLILAMTVLYASVRARRRRS
jgi:hypothetical protein